MKRMIPLVWMMLLSTAACERLADDCTFTQTCDPPDGGVGGGGGGLPDDCVPSDNAEPVADGCGVFVSSSAAAGGDGTKATPFATIGEAVANVESAQAIYLCAEVFNESVSLPAGVSLYGGLKCETDWRYEADVRSSIEPPADGVGLTIVGSGASAVEDVNVIVPDAVAPGGSSIAVIVDGAEVSAERCDFAAGDGAAGIDGDTPTGGDLAGVNGTAGEWEGGMMCGNAAAGYFGGASGEKTCAGDVVVSGGPGGNGTSGDAGGDGSTGGPMSTGGVGGTGDTGIGCQSGGQGNPGAPGTPGAGGAGFGAISASGYTGVDGEAGQTPGQPGQGGGGGGGAKECAATSTNAGPSGGGGGSGGCGGLAGLGGKAGGSSFALMSLAGTVTLTDCKLTTGNGGNGGAGSPGQEGGNGGLSGQAGAAGACAGGSGGKGGRGGAAGGGLGGHSLGIAYTGETPKQTNVLIEPGASGSGGPGGDGGLPQNMGTVGANGVSAETRGFE